ncbi:hypothetical protein AC578_1731 [Pseudocercospora eumusae]|uniref:Uncharacterized protein n=1 Tax=Pseudocercospora eumusae TaxID=321146 RepID=A0A139GZZ0_9PEZI|nr:hypothetical protein AC578_1731 [Pseudocercospora eumusae]
MCQYRYYYYAGCRHQRTILINFCDNATCSAATATATAEHGEHGEHGEHSRERHPPADTPREHAREGGANKRHDSVDADIQVPALSPILSESSSSSPPHSNDPSSPASASTIPTSLASFPEFASDTASVASQPHSRRHTHTSSVHDMAGLAPFSLTQGFGSRLMPGPASKATTAVHTTTAAVYHQNSRPELDYDPCSLSQSHRADGRRRTDESGHFVNGADALRHITNTCRGDFDVEHFTANHQHSRPPSSRLSRRMKHDQSAYDVDTYEALEAEVDSLKDKLSKLRDENEQQRLHDSGGWSFAEKPAFRGLPTRIPAPALQSKHSAAARLEEQHAKQQEALSHAASSMLDVPPSPPKPRDFPELGSLRQTGTSGSSEHKKTYARMVVHGNPGLSRSPNGIAYDSDDSIVMVSSKSPRTSPELLTLSPQEKQPTVSRSSPRFAQPTKAFARRADETLQLKDSVSRLERTSPDSKASSPRTLNQRSPKRKAIPGAWINSPDMDVDPTSPSKASTSNKMPPSEPGYVAEKTAELAPMDFSMETTLRKKISSYMSPTKAATQRAIATIGAESSKRVSPRLQKALPRINTAVLRPDSPAVSDPTIFESAVGSPETVIQTEFMTDSGRGRASTLPQEIAARRDDHRSFSRRLTVGTSVGSPVVEQLAEQAKLFGLPIPANTMAQRRGSHGHLLLPIKAKLDKVSVLKDNPEPRYISRKSSSRSSEFSPVAQTMNNVRDKLVISPVSAQSADAHPRVKQVLGPLYGSSNNAPIIIESNVPETPQRQITPEPTTADHANAPVPAKKCVPPHLRAAIKEEARRKAQNAAYEAVSNALVAATSSANFKENDTSQVPSLRATAKEFRPVLQFPMPMTEPKAEAAPATQVVNNIDIDKYYSAEEWAMLSPQVRRSICTLREYKAGRSSSMTVSSMNQFGSFEKPYGDSQRVWSAQHSALMPSQVADVFHGSPQAGQVLKPHVDPHTQAVRWTMRDVGGHETPVNFGRAALPVALSPHTPINQTSASGAHWTIGSAGHHRNVYGWSGGDGKEIKFMGHGANAERDPNSSNAKLHFHKGKGRANVGIGPRMINGSEDNDGSPGQPLAPRSRRQWAERMNMSKMPCNEINIEDATEQIPLPYQIPGGDKLFGYCPDCSTSR